MHELYKEETLQMMNTIGNHILIIDTELNILWTNDYTQKLITKLSEFIGIQANSELVGQNLRLFFPNDVHQLHNMHSASFPHETRIQLFYRFTAEVHIHSIIKDRNIQGYVHTWKNVIQIRKDKELEHKLKSALKELFCIKDALDKSSILSIFDENRRFTFVNDNFCEVTGYSREELMGSLPSMLNSDEHTNEFYESIINITDTGKVWKGEIIKKAKDQSTLWLDSTIVPFMDEHGKPYQYVTIQQDITARKQAEDLLQRTEKLSVIGELAAGVAHEIRNPMTVIKGFVQIMEDHYPHKHILLDEIDRINLIVSEFMILAKPHVVHMKTQNIIPLIQSVIFILEIESNRNDVYFHLHTDQDAFYTRCEEHQMKQVFMNIMKNSMEAMPDGGTVEIHLAQNNVMLDISIIDKGIGIHSEHIDKLEEPFFSTKEKGNGLGLMVSYRIIQNHSGYINVESQLNKGTTLTISLPIQRPIDLNDDKEC